MSEEKKRFRMHETDLGEIDAHLETDDGEVCDMTLAKSGKNKFRVISREGDEGACRVLLKRVKGALSGK